MMTMPQMNTSSHAQASPSKALSWMMSMLTASGSSIMFMTVDVILRHISQICGLASSRNEKTKVRIKSSFGSSASKPSPAIMLRVA